MSRFGRIRISKTTRRSLTGFVTFFVVLVLVLQGTGLRPLFFIQHFFVSAGSVVGKTFTYIRTYDAFQQELSVLRARVTELSLVTIQTRSLEEENEELRSLIGFTREQQSFFEIIPAQVLMRSFDDQRAVFVVNRGTADGVEADSAVVVGDGVLIGIVETAHDHFSIVRLLTDHRSRVASKLFSSETVGVTEGAKGALLHFGFIPQHVEVKENDLVFTSGLEPRIPSDLMIGFVTVVTENDMQPFKDATIEPIVDARLYRTVGVLRIPEGL